MNKIFLTKDILQFELKVEIPCYQTAVYLGNFLIQLFSYQYTNLSIVKLKSQQYTSSYQL